MKSVVSKEKALLQQLKSQKELFELNLRKIVTGIRGKRRASFGAVQQKEKDDKRRKTNCKFRKCKKFGKENLAAIRFSERIFANQFHHKTSAESECRTLCQKQSNCKPFHRLVLFSVCVSTSQNRQTLKIRLHQVKSLFLVQRAHGFGKKSENKTIKITCTFQSLRPAGYSDVCGPEVHAFPPAPLHANRSTDAVVQWKVSKFVLWCNFSPQVKMPLVRVGIDLAREMALDGACANTS